MASRTLSLAAGTVVMMLITVGCYNDGLTSQQRFELRQQQSRQNHEWFMAAQRSSSALAAQEAPDTTARSTGPYALRVDEAGQPVLIVNGAVPAEYVVDVNGRTLKPATRPAD
jgi:hypothetical protein